MKPGKKKTTSLRTRGSSSSKRRRVTRPPPGRATPAGSAAAPVAGSSEPTPLQDDSAEGNEKLILNAQLAVDGNSGRYPRFKGNVATVYTHPLSQGGASNSHYNGNAQTYMDVGLAMGKAMIELINP